MHWLQATVGQRNMNWPSKWFVSLRKNQYSDNFSPCIKVYASATFKPVCDHLYLIAPTLLVSASTKYPIFSEIRPISGFHRRALPRGNRSLRTPTSISSARPWTTWPGRPSHMHPSPSSTPHSRCDTRINLFNTYGISLAYKTCVD